jgi:hypothetical protein
MFSPRRPQTSPPTPMASPRFQDGATNHVNPQQRSSRRTPEGSGGGSKEGPAHRGAPAPLVFLRSARKGLFIDCFA